MKLLPWLELNLTQTHKCLCYCGARVKAGDHLTVTVCTTFRADPSRRLMRYFTLENFVQLVVFQMRLGQHQNQQNVSVKIHDNPSNYSC